MRRPALATVPLALVLALGALTGGATVLGSAQEEATPAATEYFPPYDAREYDPDDGAMVVVLGETPLETGAADLQDNRLVLANVRLSDQSLDPIETIQESPEVISVDTGAVAFTFSELEGEATLIRGRSDDPCSGLGCDLRRELEQNNQELILLPGDRIVHAGRARYTYRFDPDTVVPAPGTGYAAPGAFPSLACSGGCRARLTIACSGACRY